ncbi:MAG: CRISPR-associated endonuclease Cas1 [Chloroflexi bacterium]|nr:CRISPR-associated endonuclease Cas1 [Chloroflexota bacterium]
MIVEHLIADTFGSHLGKYSERLKVTQNGETLVQAPLLHLKSVTIASRGVSVSADALEICCEKGIPIFFINSQGQPYASVYSAGLTGTVLTRRAQLKAFEDWRGVAFALAVAEGKIRNQSTNLKYLAKTREETQPEIYQELHLCADEVLDCLAHLDQLKHDSLEDLRNHLLAAEGQAAKRYWAAVRLVIPEHYGWTGREGRGAADPVNSLLNYGYGILYGQIEQAIILAGLDPYGGFIHTDRPGKPSLVLDLIEEFRQVAIDRLVFGLLTRQFTVDQEEDGRLSKDTRKALADKVLEHLAATVRYDSKRFPLRFVIQNQARNLAAFLRGDNDEYAPFKATW